MYRRVVLVVARWSSGTCSIITHLNSLSLMSSHIYYFVSNAYLEGTAIFRNNVLLNYFNNCNGYCTKEKEGIRKNINMYFSSVYDAEILLMDLHCFFL